MSGHPVWGTPVNLPSYSSSPGAPMRVPDFCVPTFVLERTGRVVHRIDRDGEAWRYTLDRARREVVRIKRGNYLGYSRELSAVKARPNCIVRVYLK